MGELPSWEHGVLGEFCIIDQTTIVIRNFYYDGGGPGELLKYITDRPTHSSSLRPLCCGCNSLDNVVTGIPTIMFSHTSLKYLAQGTVVQERG